MFAVLVASFLVAALFVAMVFEIVSSAVKSAKSKRRQRILANLPDHPESGTGI